MKKSNRLGVDVDDIVKIIKASKTICRDCENNTCKVHKAGGTSKADGASKSANSQVKMNRGARFSGRAGRPSSQTSYTNEVFRQIPETTLQADTGKLNNELVKYQLELTRKQAENNQLQNNQLQNYQMINNQQQNRFKSNKFLNDDDDYGTPPRFNNYLSKSINLGMIYDTNKRIDNLEQNYFRRMGNSQFAPTESPQIEFMDNDNFGEDEMIGKNLNSSYQEEPTVAMSESELNNPYVKVNYPNDTDVEGLNPMIDKEPEAEFGVSVNNNAPKKKRNKKAKAKSNMEFETEDDDIPSRLKPQNRLIQKRAGSARETELQKTYLLRKIREHNATLSREEKIKDLNRKTVPQLEKIYNEIYED